MLIPRGGVEDTRLEAMAKDTKKFRGQGQTLSRPRPRTKDTDTSFLQKKRPSKIFFQAISKKGLSKIFFRRKKVFKNFFSSDLYLRKPKKRSLQIFCKVSGVFPRNFNDSKIVLSSNRGQGNFRGLEALRPRTSKCVLEDVLEAKDVLEDSTSAYSHLCSQCISPLTISWAKCALRKLKPSAKIARRAHYPLDLVSHTVTVSKCRILTKCMRKSQLSITLDCGWQRQFYYLAINTRIVRNAKYLFPFYSVLNGFCSYF